MVNPSYYISCVNITNSSTMINSRWYCSVTIEPKENLHAFQNAINLMRRKMCGQVISVFAVEIYMLWSRNINFSLLRTNGRESDTSIVYYCLLVGMHAARGISGSPHQYVPKRCIQKREKRKEENHHHLMRLRKAFHVCRMYQNICRTSTLAKVTPANSVASLVISPPQFWSP